MKADIQISQESQSLPIAEIAKQLDIKPEELIPYGHDKAKIKVNNLKSEKDGKLILVTSINPTAAGEGKTTLAIGLADALHLLKYKTALALREPSLGPVMGLKGGATGGGYSQVIPMEDINLHFTGDFSALTEANNTLSALIDAHIYHGNKLNIDPRQVLWKRVLDINDRELRHTFVGIGGRTSGVPREDGFDITVASEMMAILCLSTDLMDLKKRISKILVGYTYDKQPVTVGDLGAQGALALLLKDAINPNLVQTLEHTPAFVHGGPFANIAHGCNSILATRYGLESADYTITEAGFGSDLGGEKFMDIVSPKLHHVPDAVVIVATIRALKLNGGVNKADLNTQNVEALKNGVVNLNQHIRSMMQYGKPVLVTINHFVSDSQEEITFLAQYLKDKFNLEVKVSDGWSKGGAGVLDLAKEVVLACDKATDFKPLYTKEDDLLTKITKIVKKVYGGNGIELSSKAQKQLKQLQKHSWDKLPVCMAKTQYSLTDNAKQLGAPKDFKIHIREFEPRLGAGFVVVLTGNVLTMPGLPSHPAALDMDIDKDGTIIGLF